MRINSATSVLRALIYLFVEKNPSRLSHVQTDALHECTNCLHSLLDLIFQEASAHTQIKWIVSSHNWPKIIERLNIATQIAPITLELNEASVSRAVNKVSQHKVNSLAKVKLAGKLPIFDLTRPVTVQRNIL